MRNQPTGSLLRDLTILAQVAVVAVLLSWAVRGIGNIPLHDDDWDYLHQARQLYRGQGFTSLWTHPANLHHEPAPTERFHNLWKPPAMALLLMPVFAFAGEAPPLWMFLAVIGAFHVALVLLTYALGRQVAGRGTGFAAALLVASAGRLLPFLPRALSEVPFAWALVLFALALVGATTPVRTVPAGLVFGAATLLRSNMLFCLPGALLFLCLRYGRRAVWHGLVLISAAVAVLLPWGVRNALLVGDPLFNTSSLLPMMFTPTCPEWSRFQEMEGPSLGRFVLAHPGELAAKFTHYLAYYVTRLPFLAGAITPLMILLIIDRSAPPLQRHLCWAVLTMLGVQMIVVSFYEQFLRIFVPFIPLLLILAWCGANRLRMQTWQCAGLSPVRLVAILVVATVLEAGVHLVRDCPVPPPYAPGWFRTLAQNVAPGSVIATDTPDALAWFGDTRALLVPRRLEVLRRIDAEFVPIGLVWVWPPAANWVDESIASLLVSPQGSAPSGSFGFLFPAQLAGATPESVAVRRAYEKLQTQWRGLSGAKP